MTLLPYKIVLLITTTSNRRDREIITLCFYEESTGLGIMSKFLCEINSSFHINQEISLFSFCTSSSSDKEKVVV